MGAEGRRMTLLIIYVSLALGVSFLCSVLEAVLLSVSPSYVAKMEDEGHPMGPKLAKLRSEVDRPLAAILSRRRCGIRKRSVFFQRFSRF